MHGPLVGLDDLIRRVLTLSVQPPRTALGTLLAYGRGYEGEVFAIYAIYAEKWRTSYKRYQRVVSQQLRTGSSSDGLQAKALRKHLEMSGHRIPTLEDITPIRDILEWGIPDESGLSYGDVFADWDTELCEIISSFPTWEECTNEYKAQALRT
ncbi:hypothetical protein PQX77_008594 [Marasmius sp. AFHP31]|nr:hypothetical protein PQX77_008594 [Marasmius sp. AFHP31]